MPGKPSRKRDPVGKGRRLDAVSGVPSRQHGVVGRDRRRSGRIRSLRRKTVILRRVARISGRTGWRSYARHRRPIDSQTSSVVPPPAMGSTTRAPAGRVVVEGMGDDRRGDRAGVGDAEGAVVLERPDVIGGRAKPGGEAVAPAQVFISRMDRLGPGVELRPGCSGRGGRRSGRCARWRGPGGRDPCRRARGRGRRSASVRPGPDRRNSDDRRGSAVRNWRRLASASSVAPRPRASASRASASRIIWLNVLRRWRLYSRIARRRAARDGESGPRRGRSVRPRRRAQASRRWPEMTSQSRFVSGTTTRGTRTP